MTIMSMIVDRTNVRIDYMLRQSFCFWLQNALVPKWIHSMTFLATVTTISMKKWHFREILESAWTTTKEE